MYTAYKQKIIMSNTPTPTPTSPLVGNRLLVGYTRLLNYKCRYIGNVISNVLSE